MTSWPRRREGGCQKVTLVHKPNYDNNDCQDDNNDIHFLIKNSKIGTCYIFEGRASFKKVYVAFDLSIC